MTTRDPARNGRDTSMRIEGDVVSVASIQSFMAFERRAARRTLIQFYVASCGLLLGASGFYVARSLGFL